ncbi:MAG: DegT/DnrJ/EryC1/StrS family aminotransferase [Proteobacteria bacterium]|nr:DegT/DnrJ/EryC1/StrS family aminotransferase [Pseudomonadota bacterium]
MIPLFDYQRQWRERQHEILDTIQRVLNSGQLILGEEGRAFEQAMAQFIGVNYGIGVNSGTDALVLALRVLGIGPGDGVITVPNTAVPTAAAIRLVGARPVFVDVDPDTLLLDHKQLESVFTKSCKAIIPVHLHGLAVDMQPLMQFARAHGLYVIEDCAQALGGFYKGQSIGSFGDISCFSFYPTKNLGAYGDGGLCTTDQEHLAKALRQQRMYGFDQSPIAQVNGLNSRLDEIQAGILRVKFKYFDVDMQKRQNLAHRYLQKLNPNLFKLPQKRPDTLHAWHLFAIRSPHRQKIKQQLADQDIHTGIHYPVPLHLMPAFQDLGYKLGDFPVAEQAAQELLSLPLFPELSESEQDRVIQSLHEAVAQ